MNMDEKLSFLEETLSRDPQSLTADSKLSSISNWDSLSMMSLLAYISLQHDNVTIDDLKQCITVGDLCNLL